jgi:hypothetical protein
MRFTCTVACTTHIDCLFTVAWLVIRVKCDGVEADH